jgi:hypothetical protein
VSAHLKQIESGGLRFVAEVGFGFNALPRIATWGSLFFVGRRRKRVKTDYR